MRKHYSQGLSADHVSEFYAAVNAARNRKAGSETPVVSPVEEFRSMLPDSSVNGPDAMPGLGKVESIVKHREARARREGEAAAAKTLLRRISNVLQ